MKRFFLILSIPVLILFSCKKTTSNEHKLKGSWRMILVQDISTGAAISKPSTTDRDVELTFTFVTYAAGTLNGQTSRNFLYGDFSIENNRTILTSNLSVTMAMETPWGREFLDNFSSSQDYIFDLKGRLNLNTPNKILIFQKI